MTIGLSDYARMDGIALAGAIARREISAAEATDAARAACAAVNPAINAVIEFYADPLPPPPEATGPLAGVPILRKDLGATEAGRLQEMGSRLCVGERPTVDSHYAELCRGAGMTFVGRSTTPEFGISSATESVLAGITRNPWDLARMAGGSSGGAAAAVAAGIVPIAHASDGGGSIRIPAASCGIVGLKPSRGRVSQGPLGADALLGLAVEFVVCRSIRDAAAALDILGEPQPGDPFTVWSPRDSYAALAARPPGRLRIAVTTEPWGDVAVDPEIAAGVEAAAGACEALGHHVEWASPRFDFESMLHVLTDAFAFGFAGLGSVEQALGRKLGTDLLEPVTLANWERARGMTAADIDGVLAAANALRRCIGAFFANYDVLLTPGLANPPPHHGLYSQSRTDLDPLGFMRTTQHTDEFLPLFNVTGQPALVLPVGISSRGLPVAVQLAARFAHEHVALALGTQLMDALPVAATPPTFAGNS